MIQNLKLLITNYYLLIKTSPIFSHRSTSVVNPSTPPGPRTSAFASFPHSVEAPVVEGMSTGTTSLRHIALVSRTCFPLGHSTDTPVCKFSHSAVHVAPIVTPVGHRPVGMSISPVSPCAAYGPVPGIILAGGSITATDTSFLECCGEGSGHPGSINNPVTLTGFTSGSTSYGSALHDATPVTVPAVISTGPAVVVSAKILFKFCAACEFSLPDCPTSKKGPFVGSSSSSTLAFHGTIINHAVSHVE